MSNTTLHAPGGDAPQPRDLSGESIGDYQVLRRIGRGGMAEVYLAAQASLQRRVALKVLNPDLASDPIYVKRFQNEARAAAALVNANIVQIHEVGCIDGLHFIAQEYVSGQNLRQVLDKQGPMAAGVAVNIIRQAGAALHKAAQAGIVHRDIKPENIMLSRDGEVKVADFGLSRVIEGGDLNLTQAGMTMGTPLYMSPEQVEGRPVDFRSDLYSLGVTCFHMLAGEPPFTGDTPLNVAVQHIKNDPPSLEERRPDLPPGLCKIVHQLLSKQPGDRFQTAAAMLRELRALGIEADSAWPSDLEEDWSTSQMMVIADARFEATQHLQAVLNRPARQHHGLWKWAAAAVLAVCACLAGSAVAWYSRPDSLLAFDASKLPVIERQDSAQDQYVYAMLVGGEDALKSVAHHFPARESPNNAYYARLSQRRLGEFYLANGRLDESLAAFTKLASLEPTQKEFRAIGIAGQVLTLDRMDKTAQVDAKLRELQPLFKWLDKPTQDLIQRLTERRLSKPAT